MKDPILNIYDFDHTLVHTSSQIRRSTGEPISFIQYEIESRELSSSEIEKGYDFSDYKTVKNPIKIKSVWNCLKNDLKNGEEVLVLTARRWSSPVSVFLEKELKTKIPVIAVNERFKELSIPDCQRKVRAMEIYIQRAYSSFKVYEDSTANLKSLGEFLFKLNIPFFSYLVRDNRIYLSQTETKSYLEHEDCS